MAVRVRLRRDLDELVARMVQRKITRIAEEVADQAKTDAPRTKTWVSRRDGRVRKTHVHADLTQREIPENTRFKLKSMDWDREHRGLGPYTYMRWPRDETSRAVANIINCRCVVEYNPSGISRLVQVEKARTHGAVTRAVVRVKGKLAVQAERGDAYAGDLIAAGTHFLSRAASAVAARRRGRLR